MVTEVVMLGAHRLQRRLNTDSFHGSIFTISALVVTTFSVLSFQKLRVGRWDLAWDDHDARLGNLVRYPYMETRKNCWALLALDEGNHS